MLLSVVDLAFSVKTFINIELHSQGWYAVRFSIPVAGDVRAVWPTAVLEPEVGHEQQPASQAWAIDGTGYRTRMFKIKFCYEEIDISETFILQLYLAGQDLEAQSCTVDVELLFSETDANNTKPPPASSELKPVAKETLRISRIATGAHEHYSCTFDAEHFALANLAVITCLQGFTTTDVLEGMRANPARRRSTPGALFRRRSSQQQPHSPQHHALSGLADHGPPSPVGSVLLSPREGSAPWMLAFRDEASGLGIGTSPLSAALQVEVASAVAPPVVGGGAKCGAGSKMPTFVSGLDQALDATSITVVENLFDRLVGSQRRSIKRLSDFLRALPRSCYAPQSYETVRTLLQGLPGSIHRGGMGPPSAAGNGLSAALANPGTDSHTFIKHLPYGCTIGTALLHLEAVLYRVRKEALSEWTVVMWVLRACPADMHRYLKCAWELEQPRLVESWLCVNACMSDVDAEVALASARRSQMKQDWSFEIPQVHNSLFWDHAPTHPILFIDDSMAMHRPAPAESVSEPPLISSAPGTPTSPTVADMLAGGHKMPSNRKDRTETHFVIFVHGFQGNSADLCLVKGHLSLIYPYLECYSSRVNENNTSDSIQEMGARLAQEVADLVRPYMSSSRRPASALSFVGHSIGNLILRAALLHPSLQPFKHLLHMYVSICGPHLGFLYNSNAMLDAGVSVLKSVSSKGKCLHQLSFTDASHIQDCYLYKMAAQTTLADFKYIVLVSSVQDRYVPYHSSRISMCAAANKDTKRGPAYKEMARQLLKGVGEPGKAQLIRIDVDFDFKSKSFSLSNIINNKIGRQAHIEFIESTVYARFLAWTIHKYQILKEVEHTWL